MMRAGLDAGFVAADSRWFCADAGSELGRPQGGGHDCDRSVGMVRPSRIGAQSFPSLVDLEGDEAVPSFVGCDKRSVSFRHRIQVKLVLNGSLEVCDEEDCLSTKRQEGSSPRCGEG